MNSHFSRRFKRGLVVGKFCPLHLGHEFLIRKARGCCDELFIISYTKPGFPGYGRERREAWLQARFPGVTCLVLDDDSLAAQVCGTAPRIPPDNGPELEHREFVAWLCLQVLRQRVDAVFTSEDYGDGFAALLATRFNQPVAHVCVDQARLTVPVSGTRIRAHPYEYREFLAPEVYGSLVQRVCLLGAESTGKTTLAQALATTLDTLWVAEYGRELWCAQEGRLAFEDMARIGQEQVAREEELACRAKAWLVCDTSPLTTRLYSEEMFARVAPELAQLAERDYDHVFLCVPDFPMVQDGTRQDEAFRQRQQAWYEQTLARRQIPITRLSGTQEQRLAMAMAVLAPAG